MSDINQLAQEAQAFVPSKEDYDPQPTDKLRARFEKAINHVHYINEDIRRPKSEWASSDPIHVFDFEDGMRLIVSRDGENRRDSLTTIHVSASIRPRSDLQVIAPLHLDEWQAHIITHLESISNFIGEVGDRYISDPPKRVLHLWFKEIR